MKRSFRLALLLSLSAFYSHAQDWSLSLSSNVELRTWKLSTKADKEEKGLGGASIKLYKGTSLVNEVSSGANGDFQINIPANGEFMLEVSYAGCNTKRFAISTMNVPENIAKDNFKPRYGIGGFIMARPLPGVDYSYLKQPLVRVVYVSRGKFEDDNAITESSLKAVSKINDAENSLIEKFCTANREGDVALAKPDCPLAKNLYEKALGLIPGEAYPTQQLTKVGKCLKDKEESDKKAKEAAATAKQDADKKAVDDAVAKAKADKAAKDQEVQDQLVRAAEQEAKKKAAEEKKTAAAKPAEKPAEAPKAVSSPAPTTAGSDPKPKSGIIKPKEKSEEDLEAERRRAGKAKSEAEDAAAIREDAEKAEAKRKEKEKKYQENLAKEREEEQKKAEERRTKEKEQAEKEKQEQLKEAEEQRKKKEEAEQKEKEEAKKQAEEDAAEAQKAQEERDKEEAERKKKEDEKRKKTYEKIEKKYENGKSKSEYSIPPPLGSTNVYKDKITKADKLFNDKKYQEAKTVYEEALKAKPNDEYATAKLAEINKLLNP